MAGKTRKYQTACELAGFLSITVAAFMLAIWLGFLVVGAVLVLVGNAKVVK